ncbi:MAG: YihA family ribosome biogenesis GTP-binding protein, partial [Pseudomonadota bacterium]
QWVRAMEGYLRKRESLCGIFLIMDIRHPLTEYDGQMIAWCEHGAIPLHILVTKADKLKYGAAKNTLLKVRRPLADRPFPVTVQLFSALNRLGVEEAHEVLDTWFKIVREP